MDVYLDLRSFYQRLHVSVCMWIRGSIEQCWAGLQRAQMVSINALFLEGMRLMHDVAPQHAYTSCEPSPGLC